MGHYCRMGDFDIDLTTTKKLDDQNDLIFDDFCITLTLHIIIVKQN